MTSTKPIQVNLIVEKYLAHNAKHYLRIRASIPIEFAQGNKTSGTWVRNGSVLLLYPKA